MLILKLALFIIQIKTYFLEIGDRNGKITDRWTHKYTDRCTISDVKTEGQMDERWKSK
jgi:hypothetical protein